MVIIWLLIWNISCRTHLNVSDQLLPARRRCPSVCEHTPPAHVNYPKSSRGKVGFIKVTFICLCDRHRSPAQDLNLLFLSFLSDSAILSYAPISWNPRFSFAICGHHSYTTFSICISWCFFQFHFLMWLWLCRLMFHLPFLIIQGFFFFLRLSDF